MKRILSLFLITGSMLVSSVTYSSLLNIDNKLDDFSQADAAVPNNNDYYISGSFTKWDRDKGRHNNMKQRVTKLGDNLYSCVMRLEKGDLVKVVNSSGAILGNYDATTKGVEGNFKEAITHEFECITPNTYEMIFKGTVDKKVQVLEFKIIPSKFLNITFDANVDHTFVDLEIKNDMSTDKLVTVAPSSLEGIKADANNVYSLDIAQYLHYDVTAFNVLYRQNNNDVIRVGFNDLSFATNMVGNTGINLNVYNDNGHIKNGMSFVDYRAFSKDNVRLWFDREATFGFGKNALFTVYDLNGNEVINYPVKEYMHNSFNSRNVMYYDIDTKYYSADYKYALVAYKGDFGQVEGERSDFTFNEIDSTMMHYVGKDDHKIYKNTAVNADKPITMKTLSKVVDGFFTCLDNDINGFRCYNKLVINWIGDNYAFISDGATDLDIKDHATTDDYLTGNKTFETTLKTKLDMMARLSSNNDNKLANMILNNEDNVLAISITSLLILLAIIPSVILILKKRKYLVK